MSRVLILYNRLFKGDKVSKSLFSIEHSISERTFDRDIEDIRIFLSEIYPWNELVFDREVNAYYIKGQGQISISSVEAIALLKILLASRAFRKDEMQVLINALSSMGSLKVKKQIDKLISNEFYEYIAPIHNKPVIKMIWDLNQCIEKRQKIRILYIKAEGEEKKRLISPLSVVFSGMYFYLIAFIEGNDHEYPAFFRIDRIEKIQISGEYFSEYLYDKYNVGEMKNSIKFMQAGKLLKVKIKCRKTILDAMKDHMPNAKITDMNDDYAEFEAMVFKGGFIKWILSQQDNIELLEPEDMRREIREEAEKIVGMYGGL